MNYEQTLRTLLNRGTHPERERGLRTWNGFAACSESW
ncbi:unnamed protein product [Staurois parvus]|uniref:Uncharacterized protein n=1 Tax=Staurois parvus TaxID=386267 RepID=A0ABN9FPL4_9NEOB|nr:unnamed protein product [Staurois parvus]